MDLAKQFRLFGVALAKSANVFIKLEVFFRYFHRKHFCTMTVFLKLQNKSVCKVNLLSSKLHRVMKYTETFSDSIEPSISLNWKKF